MILLWLVKLKYLLKKHTMKVRKYIHSCLLIEDRQTSYLIDPGIFSTKSLKKDLFSLDSLNYILITHEHFDHMDVPLVLEIITKFPEVTIISNEPVKKYFQKVQSPYQLRGIMMLA